MRFARVVAATACLAAALPVHGTAQTVIGDLVDRGSGAPIAGAYVALLTERADTVAETLADAHGRFILSPRYGEAFLLRIDAFGYRTVTDGVFEVGSADTLWLTARLSMAPIEIGGIAVTTEARRRELLDAGFYRRMDAGPGTFITPEQIRLREPTSVSDLFLGMPQVRLSPAQNGLTSTVAVSVGGRVCYPSVFLDNVLTYRGRFATGGTPVPLDGDRALTIRSTRPLDVDALLSVGEIAAIEVYTSPAEVPLQYNVRGSGCGVVVLWTMAGGR